jgi:tRNA A-37 threonylcarbamoyl transferase component Bud32
MKIFPVPPSFSPIKKDKSTLLLKEKYRDLLLKEGIEDPKDFLERKRQGSSYMEGRSFHPSVPIPGGQKIVLRHYSHGGLLRFLTRDLYLFGSRSFQELALTEAVRSCGIPTVEPVGAVRRRVFATFYRADLLTIEIPDARNLTQFFQEIGSRPSPEKLRFKRKTIRSAGHLLRQFHRAGFFHGDLQLKNMLVSGDRVLVIDFDRSYRKESLSIGERVKNLLRLNRSAEKWRRFGLPITRTDCWRFFTTYAGDDAEIRKAARRVLRTYSIRYLLYRMGWKIRGM